MGGVVGHDLNIGLEYMDKIRKGSANCRGFYSPAEADPHSQVPAYKSVAVRFIILIWVLIVLYINLLCFISLI